MALKSIIMHIASSYRFIDFRLILFVFLELVGFLNSYADTADASLSDGDEFVFNEIKYVVISIDEHTCKTKEGSVSGGHFHISGDHDLSCYRPGNNGDVVVLPSYPMGFKLVEIGDFSFVGANIKSIEIPESVERIGGHAFWGCMNLNSVTIPSSVTKFGNEVFSGCVLDSLIIMGNYLNSPNKNFLNGLASGSKVFCREASLAAIKQSGYSKVFVGDVNYNLTLSSLYAGVGVLIEEDPNFCIGSPWQNLRIELRSAAGEVCSFLDMPALSINHILDGLEFGGTGTLIFSWTEKGDKHFSDNDIQCRSLSSFNPKDIETDATYTSITITNINRPEFDETVKIKEIGVIHNQIKYPANDGIVVLSDLPIASSQVFFPYAICACSAEEKEVIGASYSVYTQKPTIIAKINIAQTSLTFTNLDVANSNDELNILEKGVIYEGRKYKGNNITISNLMPETTYKYSIRPYIIYKLGTSEQEYESYMENDLKTNNWNVGRTFTYTPTTIDLSLSLESNEVLPEEYWWEFNGKTYNGANVIVTGLTPGSQYNAAVKLKYKGRIYGPYSVSENAIILPSLKIITLNPKCVTASNAIVTAETNISENETNVGFQWKKYDAPGSLNPNEGYAVICDGKIEGYIKNLQSTSYYNVRAFYKDANDCYFYGNWVTFDPSDFSFCQPTVKTYAVQETDSHSASVKGYALAGSTDIINQGFQYWVLNSCHSIKELKTSSSDIKTIIANGQIMTATLDNLIPSTTYGFRAFVETNDGLYYGDEYVFTTTEDTGIEHIFMDDSNLKIIGYFDVFGNRYKQLQKGINIVVYSNGSSRKILVK